VYVVSGTGLIIVPHMVEVKALLAQAIILPSPSRVQTSSII
jgi:hypothetical protein